MELDELKRSWEEYDKKLSENLRLNEELLRCSNLDRSRREMSVTLKWLGFDMTAAAAFFVLFFCWTILYCREPITLVCGGFFTLTMLFSFVSEARQLGILLRIDYYNTPVLELQKQLAKFDTTYKLGRKISAFILPILLPAGLIFITTVFAALGLTNINILAWPKLFVINCLVVLAITYPLLFWIYRNFFDKRLKAARQFLSELQEFENEP